MNRYLFLYVTLLLPVRLYSQQNEITIRTNQLLINHEFKHAVSLTDSILKADTAATWTWYIKGTAEMGLLRYSDALTSFRKAGKYFPDCIPVLTGMGNASSLLGDFPAAISYYKQILILDSTRTAARISLARAFARHGDLLSSIAQYNILLGEDNRNFAYHKELGQVYLKADSVKQGIWHLHDAINLNNHDLGLAFRLANLYIKQHDLKLANNVAMLGLRADITYAPLHRTQGYILYLDSKYPSALTSFNTCLSLGDSSLFVRKYMAYTLFNMEKFSAALPLLQWVYMADSTAPEHAYYLGLAYENLKDYLKANYYLETAIRLYKPPKELAASIYRETGNNYFSMNNWIKAYESYREAYALDPGVPSLLYSMGVLCEEHLNDKPKALQYYNRLIKQSKLDAETLENWGDAKVVPLPVLAWRRIKRLREELHFEGKIRN